MSLEDDFVPDYDPEEDEIPVTRASVRGSSQRKERVQVCPACPGRFTNVRRHVICNHLPWYMFPTTACWICKLQFSQARLLQVHQLNFHPEGEENTFNLKHHGKRWVHLVNGLLQGISEQLRVTTESLVEYVRMHADFSRCSTAVHHCNDIPLIELFNQTNHYCTSTTAVSHKVYPPANIHSVLHWRILSILISHTESGENLVSLEKELDLHPYVFRASSKDIILVDTHFHLDILCNQTRCSGLPAPISNENDITLNLLIANYCYPNNWPSSSRRQEIRKDQRLRFTYGIHPNLAKSTPQRKLQGWMDDLSTMLETRKVVGVGECGLDVRGETSGKELDRQIKVFKQHLRLAKSRKLTVVIHCRGDDWVQDICLKTMAEILDKEHRIHKHCFTGDISTYKKWKRQFSNCKFGISPFLLLGDRFPNLRSIICEMSLADLVIETDAPYISPAGRMNGCPSLTIDIAVALSSMFNMTVSEIAACTTSNAVELYNIA